MPNGLDDNVKNAMQSKRESNQFFHIGARSQAISNLLFSGAFTDRQVKNLEAKGEEARFRFINTTE